MNTGQNLCGSSRPRETNANSICVPRDAARSRFCGRSCPDLAARCFHGRSLPPMFASKGDPRALACPPTYDLGDLGILYEFLERSTVLLNFRINKDLELVLIHFLGVKNVRHLPCGFEFSGFKFPESSIYVYGGKQKILSLGSNSKGCVRGLKFLKGLF